MIRRKADPRPWRLLPPLAACAALGACHLVIDIGDIELGLPAAGGAGGAAASGGRGGAAGGIGGGAGGSLGGGGAGPACEKPAQCPGTDTTCRKRTCEDGACGVHDAPAATPCQEDGGKICDGQGSCVACTGPEHCESGVCQDHVCLAPTCADKVKNGDETDVDCGGACSPCANGKACATADDCESRLCAPGEGDAGKACAPCAKHEDCAPLGAAYCEAGTCADQKALAGSCAGAAECLSDFCADAVCCDAACEGTCRSCALATRRASSPPAWPWAGQRKSCSWAPSRAAWTLAAACR
ncbi:MAG: hypothetical protein HY744_15595 [Deltaproteobacteria bacterium]|nr:hypothetical protein [Deltaproteobacteria bacterium]